MVINGIGVQYLDWDIADQIHGNGIPNVRRNMERLINVTSMIGRFSIMDKFLYKFVQGWTTFINRCNLLRVL